MPLPTTYLPHGPQSSPAGQRAGAAVFTWQRWVCALPAPIILLHQAPHSPSSVSPQCQSHPSHLIPILSPSPPCPHMAPFLPHCLTPSSPPLTSSPHHPHYLSPIFSSSPQSLYRHFTPVVHNHLSAHLISVTSALRCPHHLNAPICPTSAPCCHYFPNPISPITSAPHSPCPCSCPHPLPVHPPSPQPHNALTTSAPSCHLSIPTQFIPSLSPLLQLHLVPITSAPSLYRPLSPSLPTITLTPILAAPPLPPSCPRHPGPTSRPFPARLTAPLTLPPLLPPKRQSARQLSAPPSPHHHWLILRTSRLPFDGQPLSQPAAPPSWPRPLPPSVERAGPGGDARGEGSNSCLETRREAP